MSPRPILTAIALGLALACASPAAAQCFADYKAKQDGGQLRLHYGVAQVPDRACSKQKARAVLERRLASAGWTLLNVVSVFGPEGLDQRRDRAGDYFLRY